MPSFVSNITLYTTEKKINNCQLNYDMSSVVFRVKIFLKCILESMKYSVIMKQESDEVACLKKAPEIPI
jgi:hypothetical protein